MDTKAKRSSSRTQKIWSILDKARGLNSIKTVVDCLDIFEDEGVNLKVEDLEILSSYLKYDENFFPNHLSKFVADILNNYSPKNILDPWARYGQLAIPILEKNESSKFDAINRNLMESKVLMKLDLQRQIKIQNGDPVEILQKTKKKFDAIVCAPPFGMKLGLGCSIKTKKYSIRDVSHAIIFLSCQLLKKEGFGVFVAAPNLIERPFRNKIEESLEEIGCSISDCINLPAGTFALRFSLSSYLIIIRKRKTSSFFVGEYLKNINHQKLLLSNLFSRKEGKNVRQGKLILKDEFSSFRALENLDRERIFARRSGQKEILFEDMCKKLNKPKSGANFKRFEDKLNSVYLPVMAKTLATTSQKKLPKGLKSYFQIILDPKVADAEYVAEFLNTQRGFSIRDYVRTGVLPRINSKILVKKSFYLPDIGVQKKVVKALKSINRINIELKELEYEVWERPQKIDKTIGSINRLNQEERFQDWIDSLPFPLGIILWQYQTRRSGDKKRNEKLLHFFESLTQFLAIVHITAFQNSEASWKEILDAINKNFKKNNFSFELTTFGTWRSLVELLSSRARKLLNSDPDLIFNMYEVRNIEVIKAVCSKSLIPILEKANSIRNNLAHGGVSNSGNAKEIHGQLAILLEKTRKVFGSIWNSFELVTPGSCRNKSGVWHYDAKKIMGSRTPFQSTKFELIEPMEDEQLYLIGKGEAKALRLLPFIKIIKVSHSMEKQCFFYSRRQKKEIKFISYSYEKQSEIIKNFEDTSILLDDLKPLES